MQSAPADPSRLATIVFDLGNVLVHFSHDQMCAQIGTVCGRSGAQVQQLLIDSGLQWSFERGLISPVELHARLETLVEQTCDYDALRHAASNIFRLNTPMPAILDRLRELKYRLVLLSNTSVWHFEFIQQNFDLLSRFDDYVLSYEVGAVKPEAAIFQATIGKLQCAPAEAFYTDDIAKYVEAGRGFGLQAEVFTDAATLVRHLRMRGVDIGG
ncbi:MAG: HAD family phosphatase [Planctomycetaceae bacterium]|nr:HAD family phosphatase [Planctomycetaceae bacterium]